MPVRVRSSPAKVSAAGSYTWVETAVLTLNQADIYQAGATVMHVPTGLGIYGMYQNDNLDGSYFNQVTGQVQGFADTDAWYLKPFIKRTWNPAGATVLFGEYGQYNDQFNGIAGSDMCFFGATSLNVAGTNASAFCGAFNLVGANNALVVTGSEVERWGLGVVQEIDSAAMHLFARWQHQDISIDFEGLNAVTGDIQRVNQDFDDLDIFQVGGIIFF